MGNEQIIRVQKYPEVDQIHLSSTFAAKFITTSEKILNRL
jgi:hypothetical protein